MAERVGIVGIGSFGTAIANLLALNTDVLVFSRRQKAVDTINEAHSNFGQTLSPKIRATNSLEEIAGECQLIFPIVPSTSFRPMMQNLGKYLRPHHFLIHGTKGFDIIESKEKSFIKKDIISTMSEVILQESSVRRVGCLSGPNLAKEIMEGQPTATLVASQFDEVIEAGKRVLNSKLFHVYGSHDILGAEVAGALKNIVALGSGILVGYGLGKNIQGMLISKGLMEMIYFGRAFGAESRSFLGTAGIGDLVATATSEKSRNFTFGYRLGKGEDIDTIRQSTEELAEGVRTLRITYHLAKERKIRLPITKMLYKVVFKGYPIGEAIEYLIKYPYDIDVDFL